MLSFLLRFCWLLRHNWVRRDNIVMCQLFLLLIIFIIILILTAIIIITIPIHWQAIKVTLRADALMIRLHVNLSGKQLKCSSGRQVMEVFPALTTLIQIPNGKGPPALISRSHWKRPSLYFRPPSCHLTCVTRPHPLLCFVQFSVEMLPMLDPITPG